MGWRCAHFDYGAAAGVGLAVVDVAALVCGHVEIVGGVDDEAAERVRSEALSTYGEAMEQVLGPSVGSGD